MSESQIHLMTQDLCHPHLSVQRPSHQEDVLAEGKSVHHWARVEAARWHCCNLTIYSQAGKEENFHFSEV